MLRHARDNDGGNFTFGYGYLNVLAAGQHVCQTGTLMGTVKNNSGEPIYGASITAVSLAPLFSQHTTIRDSNGSYQFTLPEGQYDVTVIRNIPLLHLPIYLVITL